MLARLQRMIVYGVVAWTVLWAMICVLSGRAAWSGGGVALLVTAYAATLGLEFVFLHRSFDRDDPLRPRLRQLVSAWLQETIATPRIFLWQQPFRASAQPDATAPSAVGRRGIVLVHGFVCNRGIWNRWMRRLRCEGVPFLAVNLEPVFGSLDDYVPVIDRAVRVLADSTGQPPVIVAHSMGGLAVRAWLAGSNAAPRCHSLVTLGTPHLGTWLARHSSTRNGRQMRIGSAWLLRLGVLELTAPRPPVLCFWSHCDNIVFPSANATLAGADNRHLEATPHVRMVDHPAVFEEALRLVDEATQPTR